MPFRTIITAIATACFLALPTVAWAFSWKTVDTDEGRMRLAAGGGEPQFIEVGIDRNTGWVFHAEMAQWHFDEYRMEAAFWWSQDFAGGWGSEGGLEGNVFSWDTFEALTDRMKRKATDGPTIATVLGEIDTLAFDFDADTYGSDIRQCLSFSYPFDYQRTTWSYYRKWLEIYACGENAITEEAFVQILSGLSIDEEFDALIEK
ncbi:MAG: hypothetical protein OXD40_01955 [bacterium]|nr:hypothetical protein [bacterium]